MLDFDHILSIIYLQRTIPSMRFQKIRNLRLQWEFHHTPTVQKNGRFVPDPNYDCKAPYNNETWFQAIEILRTIRGLKCLDIALRSISGTMNRPQEWMPLLQPLTTFEDIDVIRIGWPGARDRFFDEFPQDYPLHVYQDIDRDFYGL